MIDGLKTCTKCKRPKPKSDFRLLPPTSDGKPKYKAQCKVCENTKKVSQARCKGCGTPFKPFNSLNRYCSVKCREKHDKVFKEKKPFSKLSEKGKKGIAEFEKNKKLLKAEIIEQHGHLHCQRCKRVDMPLEVHHIVFRSERPGHKQLHSLINLILVCKDCHDCFHDRRETRTEIVIERGLHFIFDLQKDL